MNKLHPNKLLHTKWTAVHSVNKEKHFMVVKVTDPELTGGKVEQVEIEAVYSRRVESIHWMQLLDEKVWKRGWV
jgi:hypothetical protein